MTNRDKYEPSMEEIEAAAQGMFRFWLDDLPPNGITEDTYEEWGDKDYFRRCAKAALIAAHKARQEVEG